MKLNHKFLLINVVIIILSISITSVVALYEMQKEFKSRANIDMDARLKTMETLLHNKGTELRVTDGKMMAGEYVLNNNFEIPDQIKQLFGGAATIFMGDTRISTNVMNPDGNRAVGTKLTGPAYDAVIKAGKPYRGEGAILGVPYFTAYDPVKNAQGEVIGILYVGEKQSEYLSVYNKLKYIIAGIAMLLAATLSFAAFMIVRKSLKPLGEIVEMIRDVAEGEGDLTKRLEVKTNDELGEVCKWFNVFVDKLHEVVSHISRTTHQVADAATHLHTTAEQMATGAEEVTAQAGSVATAGEEMSATSGDIAQNCSMAADGSRQASEAAVSGARVVDETISVMNSIAERVGETAKSVDQLGKRSEQIGEIVGTIEDIADQTNLLALNAAIEAARAGEQGRGFAVVADEVRALAERTTRATKEIGEMIKAIQQETRGAVVTMEEGVEEVSRGSEKAANSGKALENILAQINEVTMQINQVATAAEEQTATTSEISNNMHQITEVVAKTSKIAQESEAAADELAGLAEDLRKVVAQFKL